MQNKGYYIPHHSRSPTVVLDDFLLVINTDLHPISYYFEVITDYCSNLVQKSVTLRF